MHSIVANSASSALRQGLAHILERGELEQSRNGPVLVAPTPVMTTYTHPRQRVLFGPMRNANPFFHFVEALWMLGGREDVAFLAEFNSQIGKYSDNGANFWGAYGYRWRHAFDFDQLAMIAHLLLKDPNSRRVVLTMWSAPADLEQANNPAKVGQTPKDLPCNTHVYFDLRGGELNMTVCNRSNDAIWGAYGANVVQFSTLLEYMAGLINAPVGVYRQFSNNLHVYMEQYPRNVISDLMDEADNTDWYEGGGAPMTEVKPYPMMAGGKFKAWHEDLNTFLNETTRPHYKTDFFEEVAQHIYGAWMARKRNEPVAMQTHLDQIAASDWRRACVEWVQRADARRAAKGVA